MADYLVQGKKGNGKSLVAVNRMRESLIKGAPVATNLDLHLVHLLHKQARDVVVMRVPDKPTVHDLMMIGRGTPPGKYNESMFGSLVLDECATWLNTRAWAERGRKETIDYFVQTRKSGWDLYLLLQSVDALESQARESCGEHIVTCRRLDRIAIPWLSPLFKLLGGMRVKMPRIHAARVEYDGLFSDRWVYRGNDLFRAYDTEQRFRTLQPGPMTPDELRTWRKSRLPDFIPDPKKPPVPDMDPEYFGTHCLLTPWHTHGRYQKPWNPERIMRLTNVYLKRFTGPMLLAAGCFLGLLANVVLLPYSFTKIQEATIEHNDIAGSVPGSTENGAGAGAVPGVSGVEAIEPVKRLTLAERFAGYVLAAHISSDRDQYYLIRHPEGGTFTNEQIAALGYRVYPVNECQLMIMDLETTDKAQVFQPGCYPRDPGAVNVDLSTWPSMSRRVASLVPTEPVEQVMPVRYPSALNSVTVNTSTSGSLTP